jgi:hypothetical protein
MAFWAWKSMKNKKWINVVFGNRTFSHNGDNGYMDSGPISLENL